MELILNVEFFSFGFEVHRELRNSNWRAKDSIIQIDYNWVPWVRKEGNLLW